MTVFVAILFFACSLAMWVVLVGKRYGLFALFFVLSVSSFVLLVLPRAGFSLKTVLAATGVVFALVVVGGANYWLRRRSVGWFKTIWEKLRRSVPEPKD
ncbi:hypothetical protein CCUG63695_02779 [Mycobacteroides franklinii]|uniref:Uncharacterized protein n=1 Tax=Mycobacteroides franklinii TaxID=948102 RepID=A0A4R8R9P1_9MYCO|nr:hypothetical protein CCUG64054_02852 [Mycobacteroides franklinii]TDZ52951.1 hypothetical protein CCUG63697_01437 [Mycobacteroides franklinii]TDZ56358.1 hypothetical protein CCUG63696_02854 [Mycobacteroides franklinii]TDZ63299.1 hypothetical protein CCUG63695_02779 [Mycobacteroides franklinii]TDZ69696.1 hypothetical protein CCUG64056_02852 [Mycobacteroides franklinii]